MEPRAELPLTDPRFLFLERRLRQAPRWWNDQRQNSPATLRRRGRPATHRSVELPLPADGQVEVAAQALDGHHPHVHRLDLQNTWSENGRISGCASQNRRPKYICCSFSSPRRQLWTKNLADRPKERKVKRGLDLQCFPVSVHSEAVGTFCPPLANVSLASLGCIGGHSVPLQRLRP